MRIFQTYSLKKEQASSEMRLRGSNDWRY